jgi:hypothetical protein
LSAHTDDIPKSPFPPSGSITAIGRQIRIGFGAVQCGDPSRVTTLKLRLAFACALTALPLQPVYADLTELTARPGGADIVDWGQLGPPSLPIFTPQSFTSVGGITGTVSLNVTTVNSFQGLVQQCCVGITGNFDGGFAPGDKVLTTSLAPLTIIFNTLMQSVVTQITTCLAPTNKSLA